MNFANIAASLADITVSFLLAGWNSSGISLISSPVELAKKVEDIPIRCASSFIICTKACSEPATCSANATVASLADPTAIAIYNCSIVC
ncbi:hypothetical protein D3C77_622190 [compost metagenome]